MTHTPGQFPVYLETGKKRTFAGAIDWPGWCRSGRDEAAALKALFDYGPRYKRALRDSRLEFTAPADVSAFGVIERLEGNATTDFGAPDASPSADKSPVNEAELQRFKATLNACWRAFDEAVPKAEGKTLRLGPRGGGRDLEKIVRHVLEAEAAYLSKLARKLDVSASADPYQGLIRTREAVLTALDAALRVGLPERGPRGGKLWRPRYFVRRVAWHVLDHAWEIEDRTT